MELGAPVEAVGMSYGSDIELSHPHFDIAPHYTEVSKRVLSHGLTVQHAYWAPQKLQAPSSKLLAMTKQSNAPYHLSLVPYP